MDKLDKNVKVFIIVIVILVIGVIVAVLVQSHQPPVPPGKYDTFAQCIKAKGLTFYGAYWCPHCQGEKKLFGTASQYLPYVECSKLDGTQNQTCNDAKISGYPTWKMPDGTVIPTEGYDGVSLATLSAKSGCALPQ